MPLTNELKTDRHIDVKSKKVENEIKFKGNFNFGKFKKKETAQHYKRKYFYYFKTRKSQ